MLTIAIQRKIIPAKHIAAVSFILACAFVISILLRIAVGGVDVARSPTAGLVFAGCLIMLCIASGLRTKINSRICALGLLGGIFLCLPSIAAFPTGTHPYGSYINWAIVVSVVALAEEAFLRGVFFDAVSKWRGNTVACLVAALAFAALHVPLYGWHVLPLDFTVGMFLGALRIISGSWVAPGISHVFADLTSWWI
jgi:membrane protease YdiL (CAAX protease family)